MTGSAIKNKEVPFLDFFLLLRSYGLMVSLKEWYVLLDALERKLVRADLLQFYYISRAILVKHEKDFDRFDKAFRHFFLDPKEEGALSEKVMGWLTHPDMQQDFDKDEVDAKTTFLPEELRRMLQERMDEQDARHDRGGYWIGTGGTSVLGHSGYSATGIRISGERKNKQALHVIRDHNYAEFRDDSILSARQFQVAFRRLRQLSCVLDNSKKEVLDLDKTIDETCNNGGYLKIVHKRARKNSVRLIMLFDVGGSILPYANLCNLLFQSVSLASHFKSFETYYFHNCFYDRLFLTPACRYEESIETKWLLRSRTGDAYKVIIVGDAAMAPTELLFAGGNIDYSHYNQIPGLLWLRYFAFRYKGIIWLNPIPQDEWESGDGFETISLVRQEIPMFPLTLKGLEKGVDCLVKMGASKNMNSVV